MNGPDDDKLLADSGDVPHGPHGAKIGSLPQRASCEKGCEAGTHRATAHHDDIKCVSHEGALP